MGQIITTTQYLADAVSTAYKNGMADEKGRFIDLLTKHCSCVFEGNRITKVCQPCFIKVDLKRSK
jgi:hypothetical protein